MLRAFAQFELIEPIGEGGMGIVYRARDTKLNREVALKLLPADKISDPGRRSRFIQEARAASALSHPNIVTIFDIVEDAGVEAIAMELIRGRTLESIGCRKGLPLSETLKYALQIADALAAAHAAGIIHRDLKPGNVMVTESGQVKVLDFGLAKLTEPADSDQQATQSLRPEPDKPRTEEGALLGTVAYMSPEQAEGKKIDARTDIFSFGAMLYEMVTGRRAFQGDSRLSILAAILREEPKPPSQIGEPAPRELERIIARCLRKDPARRFQDMDDLKVALQELKEESESGALMADAPIGAAAPRRRWLIPLAVGFCMILVATAGTLSWMGRSGKRTTPQVRRLTYDSGMTTAPALSPDGKLLAYTSDRAGEGKLDIWLQQISGGDAVRLTHLSQDALDPVFSADGSKIAFWAREPNRGGAVYVISTLGGEPRKLADRALSPQFSPDSNWIAYSALEGTRVESFVMPATGGSARPLVSDFAVARTPIWSPDGKHIVFWGAQEEKGPLAERHDWWVVPAEGGTPIRTGASQILRQLDILSPSAEIAPPNLWLGDRLIFSSGRRGTGNLWTIRLNPRSFQAERDVRQLTFGAGRETGPSVAAGGAMVFAAEATNNEFWYVALDGNTGKASGDLRQITRNSASDSFAAITEDGGTIMFCSLRSGNSDVWRRTLGSGTETAIVATPAQEHLMGMSSDGTRYLYASSQGGKRTLLVASLAAATPQTVCEECAAVLTPDGSHVFYAQGNLSEVRDLFQFDVASGQRTQVLKAGKDICFPCLQNARFSLDGKWGAFHRATSTGTRGIVVVPFRDGKLLESEAIVITDKVGDGEPYWSPDGNLLYLLSNRDGNFCVWAQRLDPVTKRPQGEMFAVHHFHSPNRYVRPRYISVARDKLVVSLAEGSSNIWLTKIQE